MTQEASSAGGIVFTVEHLTKRFSDKLAIGDLTFQIGSGVIAAFLGPNGEPREAGEELTEREVHEQAEIRNWSQSAATVLACFSRLSRLTICNRRQWLGPLGSIAAARDFLMRSALRCA